MVLIEMFFINTVNRDDEEMHQALTYSYENKLKVGYEILRLEKICHI